MKGGVEPRSMEYDLSFLLFVFGCFLLSIKIFFFYPLCDTHSIISYVFGIIVLASYQSDDDPEKDEKASEYENHLHNVGRLDRICDIERQVDQRSRGSDEVYQSSNGSTARPHATTHVMLSITSWTLIRSLIFLRRAHEVVHGISIRRISIHLKIDVLSLHDTLISIPLQFLACHRVARTSVEPLLLFSFFNFCIAIKFNLLCFCCDLRIELLLCRSTRLLIHI